MDISGFSPTTVYSIFIAATPGQVWQALTSAEFSRQYFFGFAVESDLAVGAPFIVRAPDGSLHIDGEVIACEPMQRLTVSWNVNWPGLVDALGETVVTWELDAAGEAVRLTLTELHDRPLSDDILSGGRQGWPAILSGLKTLLETGRPLALRIAPPARMLAAMAALGIRMP